MHYFQNQIAQLGEKFRKRRARQYRLRKLHSLLLLSNAELADLDISRADIRNSVLRLQLGSASVSRR